LKTGIHAIGLGEVSALDGAMAFARSPIDHWANVGKELSNALITLFANYLPGPTRRVVVKCGIGSIFSIKAMRLIWPDVPFVILVRDPLEVIVSNLQRPPIWLLEGIKNPRCLRWGPAPTDACTRNPADFASGMLESVYAEAVTAVDHGCIVIDYADLRPEVVLKIGELFGLELADDGGRFSDQFRVHSKMQERVFESDSIAKRLAATEETRDRVAQSVDPAYRRLLQASLSVAASNPAFR
jgi:hypothetical protein